MRKLDLASELRKRVGGMSRKEAGRLVDTMLDTIREVLVRGESVKVTGFGNFVVRKKEERVGRNPHSGEDLIIPARNVLTFKPSQLLRDRLNE